MKQTDEIKRIRKMSQECIKRTGGVYLFRLKNNTYLMKGKDYHKVQNILDRGGELIGYYDKNSTRADMIEDLEA